MVGSGTPRHREGRTRQTSQKGHLERRERGWAGAGQRSSVTRPSRLHGPLWRVAPGLEFLADPLGPSRTAGIGDRGLKVAGRGGREEAGAGTGEVKPSQKKGRRRQKLRNVGSVVLGRKRRPCQEARETWGFGDLLPEAPVSRTEAVT